MSTPDGLVWRKSSYSGGGSGGNCVEVAWRKSSYSGSDCVEIAHAGTEVAIRDSKNSEGSKLILPVTAWDLFLVAR